MLFYIIFGIAVVTIILRTVSDLIRSVRGMTNHNVRRRTNHHDASFQLHQQAHQDAQELHRIAHNAAMDHQQFGHDAAMNHHHTAIDMSMHMHM